jgi:hypothetical protein
MPTAQSAEREEDLRPSPYRGKDEMNLAELPFASLRHRGDSRTTITYEGWVTNPDGERYQQRWVVEGGSAVGLPTEFDERVYVALMAITAEQDFTSRKVAFSVYRVAKVVGLGMRQESYREIESALDRLVRVTFKSERAFWNNQDQERVVTTKAFHLIEEYWLRYREKDTRIREAAGAPAYIVWSEEIWTSIQAGYIKSLNLPFFYGLKLPLSRRLYRFLDKRMHYQSEYEIDIFDLAGRLGMADYSYPAWVKKKLRPGLDELVATGFLASYDFPKHRGYTRASFVRAPIAVPEAPAHTGPSTLPSSSLLARLAAHHVSPERAQELVAAHPEPYIEQKIELLEWKMEHPGRGRPVTDPSAWLIRAIEKDFQPPSTFKPAAAREAEREEERRRWQAIEQQEEEREQARVQAHQARLAQIEAQYGTTDGDRALWAAALPEIKTRMVEPTYRLWVANTQLLSLRDGLATIGVPHQMGADFLSRRLAPTLVEALETVTGTAPVTLAFEILAAPHDRPKGEEATP